MHDSAVYFETNDSKHLAYLLYPEDGAAIILSRDLDTGRDTVKRKFPESLTLTGPPIVLEVTNNDRAERDDDGVPAGLLERAHELFTEDGTCRLSEIDTDDILSDVAKQTINLSWLVMENTDKPAPAAAMVETITEDAKIIATGSIGHAYIPSPEIAKRYVHREVSGVQDFRLIEWCMRNRKNLLLIGPTGSAKTMCAEAFASEHQMPMALISGNYAMEPRQVIGGQILTDGELRWQDGVGTQVVRTGGLLVLDELNFIPMKIAPVFFPLLAGSRHITLLDNGGEHIEAHPDLMIVATMNEGYAGTVDLNHALRNRFTIQRRWGYDPEVEEKLISSPSLREFAETVRSTEGTSQISTPLPTNALMDFELIARDLGMDFAMENFLSRYPDEERGKISVVLEAASSEIEEEIAGVESPQLDEDEVQSDVDDALRNLAQMPLNT